MSVEKRDDDRKLSNQEVAGIFDETSRKYNEVVNASIGIPGLKVDYFTRVKSGFLVDRAQDALGDLSNRSVLDVGCGIGNYLRLIRPFFGSVHGIDVSAQSVELARLQDTDCVVQSYDGIRIPYDDQSFDAAYTICVLHHVPPKQWELFTREVFRVLKPGGLFMIFEHNPRNPLTQRIVDRCPFDADAMLLDKSDSLRLLDGCGFENIKAHGILTLPSIGKFSRKLDAACGAFNVGAQYYAGGRRPV